MKTEDILAFSKELMPVIREYLESSLAPLNAKIAALEKREVGDIEAAVKAHADKMLDRLEQRFERFDHRIDAIALRGINGGVDEKGVIERAIQAIGPVIDEQVRKAVEAIPAPKSVTIDDVRHVIEAEVIAAVAQLKQAKPRSRKAAHKGVLIVATADDWFDNESIIEHDEAEFSFEREIANGVRALPKPAAYAAC